MKMFCLSLHKLAMTNGTAFSGFLEKSTTSHCYAQSFWNFLPRISIPFDIYPVVSRIFRWMVRFSYIFGIFDRTESTHGFSSTAIHFSQNLNVKPLKTNYESRITSWEISQVWMIVWCFKSNHAAVFGWDIRRLVT